MGWNLYIEKYKENKYISPIVRPIQILIPFFYFFT